MTSYNSELSKFFNRAQNYQKYYTDIIVNNPRRLLNDSIYQNSQQGHNTLRQKLLDLYLEDSARRPENGQFITCNILKKLVEREQLNRLIVDLYPIDQGYSISIFSSNILRHVVNKCYEDSEILDYLDREEIPPFLLDIFHECKLIYDGCIVTELRTYQDINDEKPIKISYILLKSTDSTLFANFELKKQEAARNNIELSYEEEQMLESALILQSAEPLCLTPDPSVHIIANNLRRQQKPLEFSLKDLIFREQESSKKDYFSKRKTYVKILDYLSKKAKTFRPKKFYKIKNRPSNLLPIYDNLIPSIQPALKQCLKARLPRSCFLLKSKPFEIENYVFEIGKDSPDLNILLNMKVYYRPQDENYYIRFSGYNDSRLPDINLIHHVGNRKSLNLFIARLIEVFKKKRFNSISVSRNTLVEKEKMIYSFGARLKDIQADERAFPLIPKNRSNPLPTESRTSLVKATPHISNEKHASSSIIQCRTVFFPYGGYFKQSIINLPISTPLNPSSQNHLDSTKPTTHLVVEDISEEESENKEILHNGSNFKPELALVPTCSLSKDVAIDKPKPFSTNSPLYQNISSSCSESDEKDCVAFMRSGFIPPRKDLEFHLQSLVPIGKREIISPVLTKTGIISVPDLIMRDHKMLDYVKNNYKK